MTEVLAAEWQVLLDWKWNSDRTIFFANVVLNKTMGDQKAKEIRSRIDRQLELRDRVIHTGLAKDVLAEGRAIEGCVSRRVEEE